MRTMKESVGTRKFYERPTTGAFCVEVEGCFASSVTADYTNAGSAGEGEYVENPFGEFGTSNSGGKSVSADSFENWTNY